MGRRDAVGLRVIGGIAGGGNGRRGASRLNKMLFGGDAYDGRLSERGKWEGAMRWACASWQALRAGATGDAKHRV
jgi:hypothetical protein